MSPAPKHTNTSPGDETSRSASTARTGWDTNAPLPPYPASPGTPAPPTRPEPGPRTRGRSRSPPRNRPGPKPPPTPGEGTRCGRTDEAGKARVRVASAIGPARRRSPPRSPGDDGRSRPPARTRSPPPPRASLPGGEGRGACPKVPSMTPLSRDPPPRRPGRCGRCESRRPVSSSLPAYFRKGTPRRLSPRARCARLGPKGPRRRRARR